MTEQGLVGTDCCSATVIVNSMSRAIGWGRKGRASAQALGCWDIGLRLLRWFRMLR